MIRVLFPTYGDSRTLNANLKLIPVKRTTLISKKSISVAVKVLKRFAAIVRVASYTIAATISQPGKKDLCRWLYLREKITMAS